MHVVMRQALVASVADVHVTLSVGPWHAGIAALKHNSHLTRLNLAVCREISDEGVAAVASLAQLQSLDLTFCDRITDAGAAYLSRCLSPVCQPAVPLWTARIALSPY